MMYIAHRNGVWYRHRALYGESTLRGYVYVTQVYPDLGGIECDIHKTLDNQLVISHEPRVNIGGRNRWIRDCVYETLKQELCRLEDLLMQIDSSLSVFFFIELKEKGCESVLFSLLETYGRLQDPNCHVVSFEEEIVQTCLEWRQRYSLNLKLNEHTLFQIGQNMDNFRIPIEKVDFYSWHWKVYMYHYCSIRAIKKPHYVYTINSFVGTWIYQTIFPCDGIFTDRIHSFLPILTS